MFIYELKDSENKTRRCNVLFNGVSVQDDSNLKNVFRDFCKSILKIECDLWVNIRHVGSSNTVIILPSFRLENDVNLFCQ